MCRGVLIVSVQILVKLFDFLITIKNLKIKKLLNHNNFKNILYPTLVPLFRYFRTVKYLSLFWPSKLFTVAPVCANDREELLGALKHETLQLKCEVEASPPAESFHWTFNSSGEQTELTSQLQTTESGWSRLNYTPSSDLDYGTISCWARNVIGQQKAPCVFQIVAAGA